MNIYIFKLIILFIFICTSISVKSKLQNSKIVFNPNYYINNTYYKCTNNNYAASTNNNTTNNFHCVLKNDAQIKRDLLRGRKLRITTFVHDLPMSTAEYSNSTNKLIGKGIAFQIVDTLQSLFGFSYSIILPAENKLGDESTGILGLLYSGKVDMAAAFLPALNRRHGDLQWGTELIQNQYYVLMKRPKESASGSGLLAPFELQVWLLILISLLLVGPIMYTIIKIRDKLCNSDHSKYFPLSNCFWFVYGALMKQGSPLNPMTDSSRILFASWWLFVMILTAFYTANLTAFLTLSKFTLPIQSVNDIPKQSYHWFTSDGGTLEHAIKIDGDLNALRYSYSRGFGHFVDVSNQQTVKQLMSRGWIYLNDKRALDYFLLDDYINKTINGVLEKDRCTYVITRDSYLTRSMTFAYPKNSILPILFNPVMLSFVESGIITHLATEELPDTSICPLDLRSKERQLQNSDLYTTYKVVISGFIAAAIAFVWELFWRKCVSPKNSKLSWPIDDIINYNSNNNNKKFYYKWKNKLMLLSNNPKIEVNGREYYIITTSDGSKRLIPVRPLSSFLFQYK